MVPCPDGTAHDHAHPTRIFSGLAEGFHHLLPGVNVGVPITWALSDWEEYLVDSPYNYVNAVLTRFRIWMRHAINRLQRRRVRRVQDALMHGMATGGLYDRQTLLRRLQFVNHY